MTELVVRRASAVTRLKGFLEPSQMGERLEEGSPSRGDEAAALIDRHP